jgi:hypothetical protein
MAEAARVRSEAGVAKAAAMVPAPAKAAMKPAASTAVKAAASSARRGKRQPAGAHQKCGRNRGVSK